MIEIRWHGRGGQGCWTASRLLGSAATMFEGKYSIAFPSFGPERRGAPVLGFTKISEQPIYDRSEVKSCDYIVILDETLINKNISTGLKKNGLLIINTKAPEKYKNIFKNILIESVDATAVALEILGKPITNTAMIGALIAVSQVVSLDSMINTISQEMKASIREKNIEVIKRVYGILRNKK